ncbi:phosphatidic acid phosphatase [Sinomonas sp. JGH33]|uniref:Phosphatidic acid phosphatase n=1 Tax=Sinomonas terricola TaxID=3110330 RepID=A0ABU5T4A4_9MICC|nr:phosphatidic acid phosphatase [Sinomonas sp. JGH33]MEA5454502.1 phosphatidic acid phosphatase [Sinomonas sp. JGH33]
MQSVAKALTEIFSPAVLSASFLIVLGIIAGSWWAGLVAAFFGAIGPFVGIYVAARAGKVSGHHVRDRAQRLPILIASLASALIGLVILIAIHAPELVIAGLLTVSLGMIVVGVVNAFWKLSIHIAVVAVVTLALAVRVSPWWAFSLALIPAVAWSRIRLGDHTAAQTWAGALAGAVVVAPFLLWA